MMMASPSPALEGGLYFCSFFIFVRAKSKNIGCFTYYFQGRFRGMPCTDACGDSGAGPSACSFRGESRAGPRGANLQRTVPGLRYGTMVRR